jgi:hypothetical protein
MQRSALSILRSRDLSLLAQLETKSEELTKFAKEGILDRFQHEIVKRSKKMVQVWHMRQLCR